MLIRAVIATRLFANRVDAPPSAPVFQLHLTPTVDEFQSIDITWLRRKGARYIGYSGSLRWSRHGRETGSIAYTVEREGLRLRYRTTPRVWGTPQDINELTGLADDRTGALAIAASRLRVLLRVTFPVLRAASPRPRYPHLRTSGREDQPRAKSADFVSKVPAGPPMHRRSAYI